MSTPHRDDEAYRLHAAWRTYIDTKIESIEYLNKADFRAAVAEFSKPYRDRIAELEAQCAAKDQTVGAVQAVANMYRTDCDLIAAREADLHVMLRAFGLPTEPKALARELNGRAENRSELEAENQSLRREAISVCLLWNTFDREAAGPTMTDAVDRLSISAGYSHAGPICTCPASSEYDEPCPRHGVFGIGITGRD